MKRENYRPALRGTVAFSSSNMIEPATTFFRQVTLKLKLALTIFLAFLFALGTNAVTGNAQASVDQPALTATFQQRLVEREFTEEAFLDPDKAFRPLVIIHGGFNNIVSRRIRDMGYGGVVTNVDYFSYLENPLSWDAFQRNISYAIDELGLRVWLYDEKGYPSGTAGGLVLRERPDLEAQGLSVMVEEVSAGETLHMTKPVGHEEVRLVRAYKGTQRDFSLEDSIDLLSHLDADGNLSWEAPQGSWVVFYFVQKPFYEGTHAVNNWYESRRYINVLEAEATELFIDLTHKRYAEHVGEYFGSGIEAFFTDEPSMMGTYLGPPPREPFIHDVPNPDVPLLPTLNWAHSLPDTFEQRMGYDLMTYLPYLISGSSDQAYQVRWDYYRLLSDLFAENYMQVLESYCQDVGVACSGHLLLEEDLFHHPIFAGNLMQQLSHMQYPGIDLLTAFPHIAKNWAVTTAKLASSVAYYHQKERVHSEVSNAFDSTEAGMRGRLTSMAVQMAFGVDLFTSYYDHEHMTHAENRMLTDFIGRIGYLLDGGVQQAQVGVYYPIESAWALSVPPRSISANHFPNQLVQLSSSFRDIALQLVDNQIDFHYLDTTGILESRIEDGYLVTPSGWQFECIVFPELYAIPLALLDKIEQMVDSGIRVIVHGRNNYVIGESGTDSEDVRDRWQALKSDERVINTVRTSEVAARIKDELDLDLKLDTYLPGVLYMKKSFAGADVYLLVNTQDRPVEFTASFKAAGSRATLWDPLTGEIRDLAMTDSFGSYHEIQLAMEAWDTIVITFD